MNARTPTIYVAGPMRGHDDYNYPAFDRQKQVLEEQGWNVVNPADLDRDDNKPINFIKSLYAVGVINGRQIDPGP